jgi:hypothetical protein
MYFILKGGAEEYVENIDNSENRINEDLRVLRKLYKDDYFGLGSLLFSNYVNENSIRCTSMSSVIYLERKDFL